MFGTIPHLVYIRNTSFSQKCFAETKVYPIAAYGEPELKKDISSQGAEIVLERNGLIGRLLEA